MRHHWHHKVPKHMGGSDDPSNLELLTIEEHALAHKKLYEEFGKKQDYVAWKALSGQFNRSLLGLLWHHGKKHSQVTKDNMSKIKLGTKRTEASRLKQSKTISGAGNHFYGKTHTEEFRTKHSNFQKINTTGSGNPKAIKIRIVDDLGEHIFGCIKDYAQFKGIGVQKTQHFYRSYTSDNSYRPKPGHETECIILMERLKKLSSLV